MDIHESMLGYAVPSPPRTVHSGRVGGEVLIERAPIEGIGRPRSITRYGAFVDEPNEE